MAGTILNKKKSRDSWFLDDYTINPYSGCSFNCLFCYVRGSKYGNHSLRKAAAKDDVIQKLEKELKLREKKQQYGFIVMSSATDPYLHLEEEIKLTRRVLETIAYYRFPVHIITRSPLVIRDLDLLKQINNEAILPVNLAYKVKGKALITFSFSTIDDSIASIFEPGAPPPSERINAMRNVISEGLMCGVSMMPLLHYISDKGDHLKEMFSLFSKIPVSYIMAASLTLFGNHTTDSRAMMFRAIDRHYPELSVRYRKLFEKSDCMPSYYKDTLERKLKELAGRYEVPQTISYPVAAQ